MCIALREATDEAIRRGVPRQAAVDFVLGHINIELAIAFEAFPEGRFSDGAFMRSSRPGLRSSAKDGLTASSILRPSCIRYRDLRSSLNCMCRHRRASRHVTRCSKTKNTRTTEYKAGGNFP